jgi:hypothetical protein
MADRAADTEGTKRARREFNKHKIDISRADMRVMHGVLYLRGQVQRVPGAEYEDLKVETERVGRLLRQVQGIRDVAIDVQYRK